MDILKLPLKFFIKIIAVLLSVILIAGILQISFKESFFEGFILSLFGLGSTALVLVLGFLSFKCLIDVLAKDFKGAFSNLAVVLGALSIYAIIFYNTIFYLF